MNLELKGRIDSNNAAQVEKELMDKLATEGGTSVDIDAEGLEYISSAGLRVLLRIRKARPGMRIYNVNSEVYEILDMTGRVLATFEKTASFDITALPSGVYILTLNGNGQKIVVKN